MSGTGEQFPAARTWRYDDIVVGAKESHQYTISTSVYEHFLTAFQDYSPVHVDDAYARSRGFPGKVMHGSILNGFVSHFIGMQFPGKGSLLLSVDLRFSQPSFLDDVIRMETVVTQKTDARRVLVLDAALFNVTRNQMAARGRIQVMLQEEI